MRFVTIIVALAAPLLVSAAPTRHKRASDNDKTVLKFAEILEQLETEFYKQALAKFTTPKDFTDAGISVPEVAIQNFQAIFSHESAHTQFLDAALDAVGDAPITGCTFNFDKALTDVATMAAVARVVEAVGVGAYLGGAGLVDDKSVLTAAASILTIEARHQAFLNVLNGATGIPQAFDIPLTPKQVLSLAAGFISGCDVQGALKIQANPPLAITNNGTVQPGTLLTFDSPALASAQGQDLSCQMLVGGNATALSLPLAQCIVPTGINGPVVILLTTGLAPLDAKVILKDDPSIIAGPAIAFIDQSDPLGALVRNGTSPVQSTDQLTPAQASDVLSQASGSISTDSSTATATDSSSATATDSAAASATDSSATDSATDTASSADPAATAAQAPGPDVQVVGVSSIPA
jgi:hypothetical protein